MASQSRKRRGMATQRMVADYLREHGYPYATPRGAGEQGTDIQHTEGMAIEVKARSDWSPTTWLRQAQANAEDGNLPVCVSRPNGYGLATIEDWPAILRFSDLVALVVRASDLADAVDALTRARYGTEEIR